MNTYLGGTISRDPRTWGWRTWLSQQIINSGHTALNPMRYQDPKSFIRDGLADSSTPSSFFWKVDMGDLSRADVMIAVYWRNPTNPGGTNRQSIGTWMEVGIATWLHKPLIVVTDDPDVRDHPAIQQSAAIVVTTVEDAWDWLRKILI